MMRLSRQRTFAFLAASLALAAVLGGIRSPAHALEEPPDEWDKLKECEARLCGMILDKKAEGGDLSCQISKTWAKSSLKGGEDKGVSWGFGDARCALNVSIPRSEIFKALTQPEHTIRLMRHQVICHVERDGELKKVTAALAPKLEFKNGQAHKVWVKLKEVDGPEDIKGTAWIAANLEDKLGVFHAPLIKSINKFMHTQCPKRYGPGGEASKEKKPDKKPVAAASKPAQAAKAAPAAAAAKPDASKPEASKAEASKDASPADTKTQATAP